MNEIAFAVIASTALLLGLLGVMGALLVVNSGHRHRHRAEVAELGLLHKQAVMAAEREAVEHTMRGIGSELHDNVGQLLAVSCMGISSVIEAQEGDTRLEAARSALEQGIAEVRRLGHTLNSDMWAKRSFHDALKAECERIERAASGSLRVDLQLPVRPTQLSSDAKTILFRVFQEVVANALKHARADTITVTLREGLFIQLIIADNGQGMDAAAQRSGSGIISIRRRCALIGFDAELSSAPGKGTTWQFTQHNEPHAP